MGGVDGGGDVVQRGGRGGEGGEEGGEGGEEGREGGGVLAAWGMDRRRMERRRGARERVAIGVRMEMWREESGGCERVGGGE